MIVSLVFALLISPALSSGCITWSNRCFPSRQSVSPSECLEILFVHFVDLRHHSSQAAGGAIYVTSSSAVTLDGCTFVACRATQSSGSTITVGGACYLNIKGPFSLVRSCARACYADYGQFGYATSSQVNGHVLNLTTLHLCGVSSTGSTVGLWDGIFLWQVNPTIENVNVTECRVLVHGAAIDADGDKASFSAKYLTGRDCEGQSLLFLYSGPQEPTVQYSNFVSNRIEMDPEKPLNHGIVSANKYGMTLDHCIFQSNLPAGRAVAIAGTIERRHVLTNCVFSDATPTASFFTGTLNTIRTTQTYVLHQNDHALCSASPCPTAPQSFSRSRSPYPTTSPTPDCQIFAGGCFATPLKIPSVWCCILRDVHFVDLHGLSTAGGAIYAVNLDSVYLIGCTFLRCSIPGSSRQSTVGGAGYFSGFTGHIVMAECCLNTCFATVSQMFYFRSSLNSGHTLNSSTFLSCGIRDASSQAGLWLQEIHPILLSLNFTGCKTDGLATVLATLGSSGSFTASFLTVDNCEGSTIVHQDQGPLIPLVEYSNFNSNLVWTVGNRGFGVLFANNYSMTVRYCIFRDNIPRDFGIGGDVVVKFAIENCILSGSLPETRIATFGTGNVENTTTASYTLPFGDGVICSASPCPTISASPERSRSNPRSMSISPHATQVAAGTVPETATAVHTFAASPSIVATEPPTPDQTNSPGPTPISFIDRCLISRITLTNGWSFLVSDSRFINIHIDPLTPGSDGGAIFLDGYYFATITRTAFVNCKIICTDAAYGDGAAFYIVGDEGSIMILDCYVSDCCARYGQVGVLFSLSDSGHSINQTTIASCGGSSYALWDGIWFYSTSFTLRSLNFTTCRVTSYASCLDIDSDPAIISASFLTIVECRASAGIIYQNTKNNPSTFELCNIVNNTVTTVGIFLASSYGMVLDQCVIFGINGNWAIYIDDTIKRKFTLTSCVFAATPGYSVDYIANSITITESPTSLALPIVPLDGLDLPCPTNSPHPSLSSSPSFTDSDPFANTDRFMPSADLVLMSLIPFPASHPLVLSATQFQKSDRFHPTKSRDPSVHFTISSSWISIAFLASLCSKWTFVLSPSEPIVWSDSPTISHFLNISSGVVQSIVVRQSLQQFGSDSLLKSEYLRESQPLSRSHSVSRSTFLDLSHSVILSALHIGSNVVVSSNSIIASNAMISSLFLISVDFHDLSDDSLQSHILLSSDTISRSEIVVSTDSLIGSQIQIFSDVLIVHQIHTSSDSFVGSQIHASSDSLPGSQIQVSSDSINRSQIHFPSVSLIQSQIYVSSNSLVGSVIVISACPLVSSDSLVISRIHAPSPSVIVSRIHNPSDSLIGSQIQIFSDALPVPQIHTSSDSFVGSQIHISSDSLNRSQFYASSASLNGSWILISVRHFVSSDSLDRSQIHFPSVSLIQSQIYVSSDSLVQSECPALSDALLYSDSLVESRPLAASHSAAPSDSPIQSRVTNSGTKLVLLSAHSDTHSLPSSKRIGSSLTISPSSNPLRCSVAFMNSRDIHALPITVGLRPSAIVRDSHALLNAQQELSAVAFLPSLPRAVPAHLTPTTAGNSVNLESGSTTLITGIAIGVVLLLALIAVLIFILVRRRSMPGSSTDNSAGPDGAETLEFNIEAGAVLGALTFDNAMDFDDSRDEIGEIE